MKLTAVQKTRLQALLAHEPSDAAEAAERDFLSTLAGDDLASLKAEADAAKAKAAAEAAAAAGGIPEAAGLVAKIGGLISGNSALVEKLAVANRDKASLSALVATLTTRAEAAEAAKTALEAELATSRATVETLTANAKTVDEALTQHLAGLGMSREKLPAKPPTGGGGGETPIEALVKQMEASTDSAERGRLASQIWTMQGGRN